MTRPVAAAKRGCAGQRLPAGRAPRRRARRRRGPDQRALRLAGRAAARGRRASSSCAPASAPPSSGSAPSSWPCWRASSWAASGRSSSPPRTRASPVARLYLSGTATLVDAIAECADSQRRRLRHRRRPHRLRAQPRAHRRRTPPALSDSGANRRRRGVPRRPPHTARACCSTSSPRFLDALEAEFDLFVAYETTAGRPFSLPAALVALRRRCCRLRAARRLSDVSCWPARPSARVGAAATVALLRSRRRRGTLVDAARSS